jgi:predicted RNA-binding protein with PIN domain
MANEHILVDGYSILYQWKELDSLRQRNLATARQVLIKLLTQFHDYRGGKLSIVFDGRSLPKSGEAIRTNVEVIFSRSGESADAVIERIVGTSQNPSSFLVATDDFAEQTTVESLGAHSLSADGFHSMIEAEMEGLSQAVEKLSRDNLGFRRR